MNSCPKGDYGSLVLSFAKFWKLFWVGFKGKKWIVLKKLSVVKIVPYLVLPEIVGPRKN